MAVLNNLIATKKHKKKRIKELICVAEFRMGHVVPAVILES